MSEADIVSIFKVRIEDVPGADIFARDGNGVLLAPAQQLSTFRARTIDPVREPLESYARSRGVNVQLNKPELLAAVIECMELESQEGVFRIVDPDDFKFQKSRHRKLVQAGSSFISMHRGMYTLNVRLLMIPRGDSQPPMTSRAFVLY
jgi:hypothetical protein